MRNCFKNYNLDFYYLICDYCKRVQSFGYVTLNGEFRCLKDKDKINEDRDDTVLSLNIYLIILSNKLFICWNLKSWNK